MLRVLLPMLLLLHGLLHLVGFGYSHITSIAQPVQAAGGVLWVVAGMLFIGAAVLYLLQKDWWLAGIPAALLSQGIIIRSWPDAWYGSIANALVVLAGLLYYAERKFNKQVAGEVTALLAKPTGTQTLVTPQLIAHLPPVIGQWLQRSGVVGTELTHTVRLKQKGVLLTRPGGKWMPFEATQYFTTDAPAFIWQTKVRAFPGIYLTGRDKYENGRGEMLIKLLSVKDVVRAGGTDELNQASLLRYLAETCWFPSAALSACIRWEPLDARSARATITAGSISASGNFFFDAQGDFVAFEAMRYGDFNGSMSLEKWHIGAKDYRVFQGIRVPYKCEVTWKLKTGDYTWLQLELTDLCYNPPGRYSEDKP